MEQLRSDVETLAAMVRDSAGAGERAAARWVAERFAQAGAQDARTEPFRYQGTYAWANAAHFAAGIAAAAIGGRAGAALSLAALGSLELEASGRNQWLRRLLPATEGANAVARIPASGTARRTLVLVAHHDAAHTGLVWHPRVVAFGAQRHLRRRSVDGFLQPLVPAYALAALPSRRARAAGAAILALGIATQADVARSPTVPGASDNATGVAALIELARRLAAAPLEDVEVLLCSNGCEESGMGGMRAFLDAHPLDPQRTLVLSLDTLGAGTPIVAHSEGALLTHRYAARELDLVDAAADRAGLPRPQRWRIGGWTDPILAVFRGIPAISLLAMGPGHFPHYHHPTDTPGNVGWESVEACLGLAEAVVSHFAAVV